MWDRRTYRDTDFGLEGGEGFEPADADQADPVDLSQPHIMTVLGPIAPDQLGVCQHHEHILPGPLASTGGQPGDRLERIDLACEELEAFFTVGGKAMVDATTGDRGRDIEGLRSIAQRVPVHIIAVTGRCLERQAMGESITQDERALEAEILSEIVDGIGDTEIKPGLVKVGTASNGVTRIGRAAARAAVTSGYPVSLHTEVGTAAHEQLDQMESAGLDPARVILCHLDRELDRGYLTSIAARGARISFDQIGKLHTNDDETKAEMLISLTNAGYEDQLLISQDLAPTSDANSRAVGPGWIQLVERFSLVLMGAGAGAQLVRKLLVDNPARALAILP